MGLGFPSMGALFRQGYHVPLSPPRAVNAHSASVRKMSTLKMGMRLGISPRDLNHGVSEWFGGVGGVTDSAS